jgi:hypothetical protein
LVLAPLLVLLQQLLLLAQLGLAMLLLLLLLLLLPLVKAMHPVSLKVEKVKQQWPSKEAMRV